MHVEYPIREEHARLFLNRPVGVVLMDGTRHYGILTGCEKGCLHLNGAPAAAKRKAKRRKLAKKATVQAKVGKRKSRRASSNAALPPSPFTPAIPYGPYNPYRPVVPPGPGLALDLATIALLFALLP